MKRLVVFLAIFAAFTLLTFGVIQLDLLTTQHFLTVLYLTGDWLWLLPALIVSLCVCYLFDQENTPRS